MSESHSQKVAGSGLGVPSPALPPHGQLLVGAQIISEAGMRGPLGSSVFSVPREEKVSSAPQAPSVTDGSPRLGAGQALGQKLPEVLFTLCICRVRPFQ